MKHDSKGTKDKIIKLFYIEHKKTTEIAKKLNVVNSYVTKVLQKDQRYIDEKKFRKAENKEKNKTQKREYIRNKREKEKQEYQALQVKINNDNKLFSKRKELSDLEYANWNRSAFEYDNMSSDLILKKGINAGYAVATRVSNIVNPNTIKSNKIYV